jgi:hypothetical protein
MRHETLPIVVEKLLEGRARIEKGWCRGLYFTKYYNEDHSSFCALGALGMGWEVPPETRPLGLDYLQEALGDKGLSVTDYNDSLKTTKADILALYDRAIELALEEKKKEKEKEKEKEKGEVKC